MNAYRFAEIRPMPLRSRLRRRALAVAKWLGAASLFVVPGAFFFSLDVPNELMELTGLAATLGFVGGAIAKVFEQTLRRTVAFMLAGASIVELAIAIRLDLTGAPFALLAALSIPASICGTLLGYGLFSAARWLATAGVTHPAEDDRTRVVAESRADWVFVRQLASSTTLFAVVIPLTVAGYLLASIRRDATVDATAAIVGASAAIAFGCGELLQLRDVSTRMSAIVVAALVVATTAAGLIVDRRLFDDMLGFATPYGAMLPGATTFAAIAGWFAATGLRVVGQASPVFHAIARREHLVDDEEPVSDEVLPPSTRRLLDRVRSRRKGQALR